MMVKYSNARRPQLAVVVLGAMGSLGAVWVAGVAVAAGEVPVWAVAAAVGAVAVASAAAWLLGKVSHGGDWAKGPRRPGGQVRRPRRLVSHHV